MCGSGTISIIEDCLFILIVIFPNSNSHSKSNCFNSSSFARFMCSCEYPIILRNHQPSLIAIWIKPIVRQMVKIHRIGEIAHSSIRAGIKIIKDIISIIFHLPEIFLSVIYLWLNAIGFRSHPSDKMQMVMRFDFSGLPKIAQNTQTKFHLRHKILNLIWI